MVFAKNENDYYLYYNGELVDEVVANNALFLDPGNSFDVSANNCNGLIDNPFQGYLDEIKLFDRFLSPIELTELSLFPDKIINQDTTIFLGDALQIATGESCSTSPSWSPTTGVDNPNILDPMLSPMQSTLYTLSLPGPNCSTSDTIQVNVIDPDSLICTDLLLPNAFTPNGDNLNDVFGISNEFIIEDLGRFEIFDRWGESVFYTTDKNITWDGSFKGKPVNPAMFLYVVSYTCKGQDFTKSGSISVLR